MNSKTLFQVLLTCLLFISCDYSKSRIKIKTKQTKTLLAATYSINDVEYLLKNYIDYKNTATTNGKGFQLENEFVLWEIDRVSGELIHESKFENKIDLKNIEELVIDSISFTINENKDKINLKYFLNLGDHKKMEMFELLNDGETWNIN